MTVICAWCRRELHAGDDPTARPSHGICPACQQRLMEDLKRKQRAGAQLARIACAIERSPRLSLTRRVRLRLMAALNRARTARFI